MKGSGKKLSLERRHNLTGWVFLIPATALIAWMSFYPMIQAFILSLQTGLGINLKFGGLTNYTRILQDATFRQCLFNTIFCIQKNSNIRKDVTVSPYLAIIIYYSDRKLGNHVVNPGIYVISIRITKDSTSIGATAFNAAESLEPAI